MTLNEFEAKLHKVFTGHGVQYSGVDLSVTKENVVDPENDDIIIYCVRLSVIGDAEELGLDELVWAIEKL